MRDRTRSVAQRMLATLAPWRRRRGRTRRRLDWLVLLPPVESAHPAIAIVGSVSDEDRHRIAAHFSAVDGQDDHDTGLVDVVVALEADHTDIAPALGRLSPTGAAFVTTTRYRDRRAVSRAVDSTGRPLSVASAHWMVPTAVAPRRFIPLGRPEPLQWYLRNLFAGNSALMRFFAWLVARGARWAPDLMRRQALVMAGSASHSQGSELLGATATMTACGDQADAIVITSGFDAGSRTVVLPFERGGVAPRAVVKVAAHVSLNALTRNEQGALGELRAELPPTLAATVPRPLGDFEWRGRSGGVESAFDGPTLAVQMIEHPGHQDQVRRLRQIGDWLAELNEATLRPGLWDANAHERWILETTSQARLELVLDEAVERLLVRLEEASRSLIGLELPTVRRHFDLGPWNIVMTGHGVGVIDWEYGRSRSNEGRGLPLCDLEYFVKYWLHAASRAHELRDELGLFHWLDGVAGARSQELIVAARSEIARSCDTLRIDRRFIPVLSAYEWIEQAVHNAIRTRTMGTTANRPNSAREYLPVLAEHLRFESA